MVPAQDDHDGFGDFNGEEADEPQIEETLYTGVKQEPVNEDAEQEGFDEGFDDF